MERNGIEYDPETNLPKLRDGLIWQIHESGSNGYLSIAIVESITYAKHTFLWLNWGWTTEYLTHEGLYSILRTDDLSDTAVQKKAEELFRDLDRMDETKRRVAELVGNYPPKKL